MKKIFFIIMVVVLLSLIFFYFYNGNTKRIIFNLTNNKELKLGQLKYRIYVLGVLPIVELTFYQPENRIYKKKNVLYLAAQGEILKIYDKFYTASLSLGTYLDKEKLVPLFYEKKVVRYNMKDLIEEVEYDQARNVALLSGYEHSLFPNTKDPLSSFYEITSSPIKNDININVFTADRIYTLEGKVKENKFNLNNKDYSLLLLNTKITKKDGSFYKNKVNINMCIVKLKDKENVPILIDIICRGLLLRAKLIEIK